MKKIDEKNSFFLYTGRVTCPESRMIVPYLSEITVENDLNVFYLNSEDTDADEGMQKFRGRYEINSVPSIIYFHHDGKYYVVEHNINLKEYDKNKLISSMENTIELSKQ